MQLSCLSPYPRRIPCLNRSLRQPGPKFQMNIPSLPLSQNTILTQPLSQADIFPQNPLPSDYPASTSPPGGYAASTLLPSCRNCSPRRLCFLKSFPWRLSCLNSTQATILPQLYPGDPASTLPRRLSCLNSTQATLPQLLSQTNIWFASTSLRGGYPVSTPLPEENLPKSTTMQHLCLKPRNLVTISMIVKYSHFFVYDPGPPPMFPLDCNRRSHRS
jgi:hypothetical protein